jgi:hypothetical protein
MNKIFSTKWRLSIKVLPFIFIILVIKILVHSQGYEFIALSSLFTALISANIFLIGFLISGVLVDYKESEKIPADFASGLETMADECEIIYSSKKAEPARECKKHIKKLNQGLIDWFYKREKTAHLMLEIKNFNQFFLAFEPLTQANFIVRLKQEQNSLRKLINRAHTIRETSFNRAGYTIAEIITFFLTVGLIFTKLDPFYENVFFVIFVPFILIYMIILIKDLDNPFEYYVENKEIADEVSLKPLLDLEKRLTDMN